MSLSQPLVSLPFQLVSLWQALLYYPWLCDGHWEQCLPRLHFFGKHHNPRVRDGHWDACLLRLQRSITIPSSVKVTIPQSVKAIQDFAFAECKSLASVTIPQWRLFGRLHRNPGVFEAWLPAVFHAESKVGDGQKLRSIYAHEMSLFSCAYMTCMFVRCLVRMVAKHLAGLLGGHVQLFFPIFVNHESTGTKSRWPLVSLKFGSLQRVCDSHWGRCLWGLQAFGKHYNPSSLWGLTASRLSCRKQGERVPVCTLTLAERWPLPIFLLGSIYAHEMSLFSCAYMTCEVKAGLLGGHVQLFFPTFVEQRAACLAEIWVFFELFTIWGPMKAICRDLVLFICHPTGF